MSAAGKLVSSDGALLLRLLKTVPQWHTAKESSVLTRKFVFKNFSQGWGFMSRVALEAEKLDHHPNWYNVYNTVQIELSTHSAGGLTEKDFKLAQLIDSIAEEIPNQR